MMFWERFNSMCRANSIAPNAVCSELGFSSATATHWKNGAIPKGDALIKIADYFNCPIDYLLGREQHQPLNVNNSVGISNNVIGHTNDHVTIHNGTAQQLSAQEQDLLRIYNNSNGKTQHEIMTFVYGIEECNSKEA